MILIPLFFIWVFCIMVGTVYGSGRNAGCLSAALTILLGPIGLIIVLLLPKPEPIPVAHWQSPDTDDLKKCPYCAEMIQEEAIVCRYCGRDLPEPEDEIPSDEPKEEPEEDPEQAPVEPEPCKNMDEESSSWVLPVVVFFLITAIITLFIICGSFEATKNNSTKFTTRQPASETLNPIEKISWAMLARSIKSDYQGKITAIEQLNGTTCWVVIRDSITDTDAVSIAENVGYYVKNNTGGIYGGDIPSVHVFRGGKHIATARFYSNGYEGKIEKEDWDPSTFNGKYRP